MSSTATPSVQELLESLKAAFLVKGSIEPPNDSDNSSFPPELQELLKIGSSWHLTDDDMYGFNIMPNKGKFIKTVDVIGDEELMEEWAEEHGSPNVCEEDYKCLACFTEYDYVFVNTNPSSEDYGCTRLCVNNCAEDEPLTPAPFSNFLRSLLQFTKDHDANPDLVPNLRAIWNSLEK